MEEKPTTPEQAVLTVVALALIDEAGLVLMQRRPAHRTHGGLWEFPGGKVEPGEGTRAALVREIEEELGLTLAADALVPVGFAAREGSEGEPPLVLLLYACRAWQGTRCARRVPDCYGPALTISPRLPCPRSMYRWQRPCAPTKEQPRKNPLKMTCQASGAHLMALLPCTRSSAG